MKILQFILCVFLALTSLGAASIDVTPAEQAWLEKTKTLRVRIVKEMMPYQRFENDEAMGISVEYIKHFANTFNLTIQYVTDGTWAQALERIQTRDGVDVLLKATSDNERLQKMLFTQPYASFPFALATHKSNPNNGILDAPSYTIALAKSYVINEKLKRDFPLCSFRIL
jgi:polar amino acid transport system substrate-binding protein